MIREYLPFKAAREYADRGMAKWMGFFISEHTTAIHSQVDTVSVEAMDPFEKVTLLNQLLLSKVAIVVYIKDQREPILGVIKDYMNNTFYFETENAILTLQPEDIVKVTVSEEDEVW